MSSFFNLPTNLCVKSSYAPKGENKDYKYAVWSVDEIPFGIRFGPYEVKSTEINGNQNEALYWQVNRLVKEDWDERIRGNWLCLINYTSNKEEQNMVAIRHRATVYYVTSKCIPANTELLVFYTNDATKTTDQSKGICSRNNDLENVEGSDRKDVINYLREKKEVLETIHFHPNILNGTDRSVVSYGNSKPFICNENYISAISRKIGNYEEQHGRTCTELKCKAVYTERSLKGTSSDARKSKVHDNLETGEIHANTNSFECNSNKKDSKENMEVDEVEAVLRDQNDEDTYKQKDHKRSFSENISPKPHETICDATSSSALHENKNTEERQYECNVCLKNFSSKNALLVHNRVHTGEKPYKCKICEKKYAYNHALKDHVKTHTGENLYECDLCDKKFANCANLYRHRKIHTGVKLFECKTCQKKFYNKCDLRMHGRTHTGEKPYECKICQKRFTRNRDLIIHRRIHTGETPFQCDICQKSCNTKRSLMFHARVHTGEKPYECEVCQTKFAYSQGFKAHLKVHTGETPYICNFCNKKFSSNNVLKTHERIHTGEKPYECNICQRKFAYSSVLKGHIRTHTGEYPFHCNFCEKKFVNSSNLSRHVKVHTGDRPFVCNVCEKRFTCKRYLLSHTKNHFREKPRIYNFAYVSLIMKQIYPEFPVNDT